MQPFQITLVWDRVGSAKKRDLPDPETELMSPALQADSLLLSHLRIPLNTKYVPNMVIDPGNRVVDQLYKVLVLLEFIFHKGRWIVKNIKHY